MSKRITKERADEITAAWDAATDVQRLGMPRIQWLYMSGGNGETDYWEHEPPPLEKAAAARIAELEAALRDAIPFLAVNMDKYRRDYGLTELHPTHAEIIDRISRLSGGEPLSKKLTG